MCPRQVKEPSRQRSVLDHIVPHPHASFSPSAPDNAITICAIAVLLLDWTQVMFERLSGDAATARAHLMLDQFQHRGNLAASIAQPPTALSTVKTTSRSVVISITSLTI